MDDSVTRRRLLRAGGAASVGLATALAGCGGNDSSGNGNGGPGGSASLDSVPAGVTGVFYADLGRLLDDAVVRQSVNRTLELIAEQDNAIAPAESYEELLSMADSEFGLDPRGLQSMLFFSDASGSTVGMFFEADWSEAEIIDTIERQGASISSRKQDGHTIYADDTGEERLVALADGRYLVAEGETIESVLDVLAGDARSVGGAVADAYAGTSGMVRFAADVSETDMGGGQQLSAIRDAQTVSGSLTASGNTRTLTLDVSMTDAESATEMAEQADALLTLAKGQIDQYPEIQEYIENPRDQLDAVEVSSSGSTVTVTYGGSVDFVAEGGMIIMAAVVGSFVLGLGESVSQTVPQATFQMEFDTSASGPDSFGTTASGAESGILTVTHTGGDAIPAGELTLTGGLDGPVSWADSGVGPGAEVTAGVSVDYAVASDATVSVVWQAGDSSAVLSRWDGPDA